MCNADLADAFMARPSAHCATTLSTIQHSRRQSTIICSQSSGDDITAEDKGSSETDETTATITTVGSSEYYQGFLTRSVNEEPTERVTGDAILGPTLKFAGGIGAILVALTVAFLASNGLI